MSVTWPRSSAPRRTSSTRPTSGPGDGVPDAFALAFSGLNGADVYYASKAFTCTAVTR